MTLRKCEIYCRLDAMGSQINRVGRCGLDLCGPPQGPVVGPHEHCTEPSGSIRGWEFLD
jgi:hypothetical protein